MIADDRIVPLAGIANFRDCGGYPIGQGKRMRKGLVYRSGQHSDATQADLAAVARLGLALVVDLRSESERRDAPNPHNPGCHAEVLAPRGETTDIAPHLAAARLAPDVAGVHTQMRRLYADLPYRPAFVEGLRLFFAALARAQGPVLVNCLAGKDRTGLAVALLHRMLGVDAEAMIADYLLTNTMCATPAEVVRRGAFVRARFSGAMSDETVRALLSVTPDYLATAFAAIEARSGSIDTYLMSEIGLTPASRIGTEKWLIEADPE